MSFQYVFCPTCGTRRVAHGFRCSVCDGLVPRTSTPSRLDAKATQPLVRWQPSAPFELERRVAA